MTTEAILKQVRDRLGPLNGQAEQAVAEAVEIIHQMSELPSSLATNDNFIGENASLDQYLSWADDRQRRYQVEAKKVNAKWITTKLQELGADWLIVVDGKIVAHGPSLQTFPPEEEFEAICKKVGKSPFVIFNPRIFLIEESVTINPNRTALLGRNTLLQLQPIVLLDFAHRQAGVEYSELATS